MKKISQIIDKISDIGAYLVCIAIIVALVLTATEVVVRSFFHSTIYIANEYGGYCMAMICFFSYGYCLKENGHIRMNMIDKRLKGTTLHIYHLVLDLVGLVVSIYMTKFLIESWVDIYQLQTRSIQVSRTLLWIPQIVLPIGSVALCLQFVSEIIKSILLMRGDTDIHIEEGKDFI